MAPKRYVRLRDGTVREFAADELVPDGATVFCSILVKDERYDDAAHAARDEAYEQMRRDLTDAWKGPADQGPAPAATAEEAYQQMKRDISNAWREPER